MSQKYIDIDNDRIGYSMRTKRGRNIYSYLDRFT